MTDDQTWTDRVLTSRLAKGDPSQLPHGIGQPKDAITVITAKRWRRSALSKYSSTDLLAKIERAWQEQAPLVFTVPCGGYKSWRVPSSPFPNWAEVFFVDYLRRFIREISSSYPYGVRAELTYVSGVMDLVSNYHPTWQSDYVAAMQILLAHHSDEPGQLAFVDIALQPGVGDMRAALMHNYGNIRSEWDGDLSESQIAKLRSAERNFAPDGAERVPEVNLRERVIESAILCDALDALEARRTYNKFGPRIQLVFDRRPQPAVHIGTCETSTAHFWVSEGVLDRMDKRLLPRMIGHTSLPVDSRESVRLDDVHQHRASIGAWLPELCQVV
jgi:hypothetical protein